MNICGKHIKSIDKDFYFVDLRIETVKFVIIKKIGTEIKLFQGPIMQKTGN
jgi:hypothetical protein